MTDFRYLIALLLLLTSSLAWSATDKAPPQVKMETNMGTITLELDPVNAPITVENFLKYVADDYYTGTIFHRVISGFMIQGGGFTEDYSRKKARAPIKNEANNGLKNNRGTIAMARTGDPHSATAQFFINTVDNHSLNFSAETGRGWGYAVFGKVTNGMDVVDKIRALPTGPGGPFPTDAPKTKVVITKVSVVAVDKEKKESDPVKDQPAAVKK